MYAFKQVVGPTVEPLSLAEAKAHLRVDISDDDAIIIHTIAAARQWVEAQTARALITQTWRLTLDAWPKDDAVTLIRAPVQSVSVVRTLGENGVATIWSVLSYALSFGSEPQLLLKLGGDWPVPGRVKAGIEIDLVCGYGSTASDVPDALRQAILLTVAKFYERRGDDTNGAAADIQALIAPFRVVQL